MTGRDAGDRRLPTPHDTAWMITGNLTAGILIYGGIGWLLSLWFGHRGLFIATGILFGMFSGLLLVYYKLQHETEELKQKP